jgi:hypothetical protein
MIYLLLPVPRLDSTDVYYKLALYSVPYWTPLSVCKIPSNQPILHEKLCVVVVFGPRKKPTSLRTRCRPPRGRVRVRVQALGIEKRLGEEATSYAEELLVLERCFEPGLERETCCIRWTRIERA